MIETPTRNNLADFKQRYQGVLGWLNTDVKKTLVNVHSVGASRVVFHDSSQNEFYANVDGGALFEFLPVVKGWYYTPVDNYFVTRIPARMWKRGIAPDNTNILQLVKETWMTVDNWRTAAFNIFNTSQELTPERRALKDVPQVLSKHFAVSMSTCWFYNLPIGKVNHKTRTIILTQPLVRQELMDLIRREQLDWKVE